MPNPSELERKLQEAKDEAQDHASVCKKCKLPNSPLCFLCTCYETKK